MAAHRLASFVAVLAPLVACVDAPDDAPDDEAVRRETVAVDPGKTPGELDPDPPQLLLELDVCADAAYTTIGDALEAAGPGAVIRICPGLYEEHLDIQKQVTLIGAGADQTILDGGGVGRVVSVWRTTASIEGVTIQHGLARTWLEGDEWADPHDDGGGARCVLGTMRIAHSVIRGNVADHTGGGIASIGCTLALEDVEVSNNDSGVIATAHYDGGPLTPAFVDITGSRFLDNDGGGVLVDARRLRFVGNVVRGNGVSVGGGGLNFDGSDGLIADNVFEGNIGVGARVTGAAVLRDNLVTGNGGGYAFGQGHYRVTGDIVRGNTSRGITLYAGDLTLTGVLIEGHHSTIGAGIYAYRGHGLIPSLTLEDSIVRDNVATGFGGGILVSQGGLRIRRSVIANNQAPYGAGIVAGYTTDPVEITGSILEGNVAATDGGAVHVGQANLVVRNSIFTANRAARGGALWLDGDVLTEDSHCWSCPNIPHVRVEQTTFHANHADAGSAIAVEGHLLTTTGSIVAAGTGGAQVAVLDPSATVAWQYNDTFPATFAGMPDPVGNNGNIAEDPRLTSELRLGAGSPCIDAGPPGLFDPDGTRADMGAFGGPEAMLLP